MPFFPLIKMPSNASRYSCTCSEYMVHLSPSNWLEWDVTACGSHGFVSVPALDPQQKCHQGWGKSRTPATRIQCSQTASAPQGHSAAELGPGRTMVRNHSRNYPLARTTWSTTTAFHRNHLGSFYLLWAVISIPDEAAAAIATLIENQKGGTLNSHIDAKPLLKTVFPFE